MPKPPSFPLGLKEARGAFLFLGERERLGEARKGGGEGRHKSEEEPVDRPAGATTGDAPYPGEASAPVAVVSAVAST